MTFLVIWWNGKTQKTTGIFKWKWQYTNSSQKLHLPGQSWDGSTHWVESEWHVWNHGSSQHWQNCTWRHRSPETRLQSGPCHRSAWSSRPGQVQPAPPSTRRDVKPCWAPGPGASAPALQAWAAVESIALPHITGCNPVRDKKVQNGKLFGEFSDDELNFLKHGKCCFPVLNVLLNLACYVCPVCIVLAQLVTSLIINTNCFLKNKLWAL